MLFLQLNHPLQISINIIFINTRVFILDMIADLEEYANRKDSSNEVIHRILEGKYCFQNFTRCIKIYLLIYEGFQWRHIVQKKTWEGGCPLNIYNKVHKLTYIQIFSKHQTQQPSLIATRSFWQRWFFVNKTRHCLVWFYVGFFKVGVCVYICQCFLAFYRVL